MCAPTPHSRTPFLLSVRPLAVKYSQYKSIAILFCMLFNRESGLTIAETKSKVEPFVQSRPLPTGVQFLRDSERDLAFQNVNLTRAALCELLAIKLLRTFSNDGLELVTALTASFSPFSGADDGALTDLAMSGKIHALSQTNSALELAVVSSVSTRRARRLFRGPTTDDRQ